MTDDKRIAMLKDLGYQVHEDRGVSGASARDLLTKETLAALKEARDMVESWGAYAGDYFKEKWDLAGDLEKLDKAIAKAEAVLAKKVGD